MKDIIEELLRAVASDVKVSFVGNIVIVEGYSPEHDSRSILIEQPMEGLTVDDFIVNMSLYAKEHLSKVEIYSEGVLMLTIKCENSFYPLRVGVGEQPSKQFPQCNPTKKTYD